MSKLLRRLFSVTIYEVNEDICAEASGMFFWRKIKVGNKFSVLPEDMKQAALAHEMGHHFLAHIEERLLCVIFCFPLIFKLCKRQELEADEYSAKAGYARGLIRFFESEWDGGLTHPSHKERRDRMKVHI